MSDSRTLVQRYFDAFEGGSLAPMRDFCVTSGPGSFVYELLPHSMGVPPKNLEEYIAWIAGGLSAFKDGKLSLEIIEFLETRGSNKAVAHAKCVNSFGVNGAPYKSEYIFIITFVDEEDSGTKKILRIQEFIDTAFFTGFMDALSTPY